MNVYEKLQKCRVELQNKSLKKSGNNKFAGYTYFELGDFLQEINKLCLDNKLLTRTYFTPELATLEIINAESPEEVVIFTSPMADANLKGCHAIQNVGAVETYQRRYLLMLAFEIVESDGLEAVTGKDEPKKLLSDAQVNRLLVIAKTSGFDKQTVEEQVKKKFGLKLNELSKPQYETVVAGYEKLKGDK